MGVCQSQEEIKAREISKKIDRDLQVEKQFTQKLLILGPAESGKSTCVKQMQILHNNGFSKIEMEERKSIVFSNAVRSMYELIQIMNELSIRFNDSALENEVNIIRLHVENGFEYTEITSSVKLAIQRLWKDSAIIAAATHKANYHVIDSAAYFFENIERLAGKNYLPTNQDILMTRMPTTGVVKLVFTLKNIEFNVFDVGGQRSERRKWIHFFDDVNAIIFVAAINEYDQKLREDNKTNRLIEAMELFDGIANSKFFTKSSMILFMNKKDLFAEKIQRVSLNILFPSYKGGLTYEDGVAYLRVKFRKLYRNKRSLYIHETFATDTNQINTVFRSVLDTIIQENMQDTGML
ncbi:hypothetical protein niasHS_013735 [Heterodera schachtii]|uniref:Uncharacterized protein n=1 Tax=Heterodera schachtii TaxID=97005 RepID=A0ABD2IMN4_HETSC